MSNAETLRRLRADAVKRGLCYQCRCRFPRLGLRTCDACLQASVRKKANNVAAGLCPCGRPGRDDRTIHCTACLDRNAKRRARTYADAVARGMCIACLRTPHVSGRTRCFRCLDQLADRVKAHLQAKRGPRQRPPIPCSVCGEFGHNKRRHERWRPEP